MKRGRAVVAAMVLAAVSSPAEKPKAVPAAQKTPATAVKKLPAPDYLNELARQLLRKRMARHGHDMTLLVQGVILLQRDVVTELAGSIASEPRITRPIAGGADDLNAALPERFFVLQDQLRERARALSEVAKQKDDAALAARLGELTQTCVGCHSAYLEPKEDAKEEPAKAPEKAKAGAP